MYLVRPPYLLKRLYPHVMWRKDLTQKKIYLTFDDGPVPLITPWVLDLLKKENIKATFFCIGENVMKNPEIFKRILDEGHAVGNHTYNHLNGWNTDTTMYLQNIKKCAESINSKLFRPPYGRIKKNQILKLIPDYSIIMWDVLSGDYDGNTNPEKCLKNVTDHVRNGSVIVFHDSSKAFRNLEYALPKFILFAKENKYAFELLNQSGE